MRIEAREMNGVFRIRYGRGSGTCFMYHGKSGICYITAAHIMTGVQTGEVVYFQLIGGDWFPLTITQIEMSKTGYDVCAFAADEIVNDRLYPIYDSPALLLGDELKFLGFPHGLNNNYPGEHFAMPLLRTAHFSGVIKVSGVDIAILDGFNNPGYSGGPVFGLSAKKEVALFGVISGYRPELASHGRIYKKNEEGNEEQVADYYTKPNSGMIQCSTVAPVEEVYSLMRRFVPIGTQPA